MKIPPIVLHKKERWTSVSGELRRKGWKYDKAMNTAEGIKMFPTTEEDFRAITGFPKSHGKQFHSYMLPEDRQLRVVIRGLPLEIDLKDVEADVKEKGFSPTVLTRMKKGSARTEMLLILVKVPQNQRQIYEITELCMIWIKLEPLRRAGGIGQCSHMWQWCFQERSS